ncbi:MAG: 30S ribosomal protein S3 [Candidatus Pacearchaeota archaeon]|nr:30S ribosomal protein S3 [Candidatus Pacearchaeota archaeon]
MEEKKFVQFKKEELGIKEYVKKSLGKGRISDVSIEYTPVGEKIIVATNRPGLVIGRRGEKINELTSVLKKRFNLDNPHIEIKEIENESLDAQLIADSIAINLERKGSLKFKLIAYRTLKDIMNAGALGSELVLSGKLPSDRARTWRFAQGYLKKTGDSAKVVDRAKSIAFTKMGVVGIKVGILSPDAILKDRVKVDDDLISKLKKNAEALEESKKGSQTPMGTKKKAAKKKSTKKTVKESKK